MSIDSTYQSRNVMTPVGGRPYLLVASGTTDSAGDATLDDDFNGLVSITNPGSGVHVVTFKGGFHSTLMPPMVTHGKMSTITVSAVTTSASAGTVTITFGAALTSSQFRLMLLVSASE